MENKTHGKTAKDNDNQPKTQNNLQRIKTSYSSNDGHDFFTL